MNYFDRIKAYHNRASGAFKNAVGDEQVAVAQPLDLNDRTLTVEIAPISSTVAGRARIFGSNAGLDETYNTANNMSVTVPESSHNFVKNSILGNPFRIKGILYTVSNLLQLAKPFYIIKQTIAGATSQKTWQPSKYTAPTNYNSLQIKTSEFQAVIDADTRIEIDFLAGYTASMVLSISDMLDMAQALSNRTPIKSATK
jgi:hypothetical protein